jgi:UDP-N-acetylmuramoyl-tripeptide--D-alanyl-D-alanine ligase
MIELNQLEKYIISKKDKIQISSKDIKSGDIFLALKGKRFHGNKFLNEAIDKGAKFCVTDNKNFKKNKKILYVNNIYKYLSKIAKTKRDLYKGKVIGITGSAGKTTLKETLAFFLKKDHTISYSKKSYNNQLGVLISLLNLNLKSNYAIFEIGTNNFGEIKFLSNLVKPSEVFITNIQSTHLENFQTKNNIAREKADIFISKYNNNRKKLYLNVSSKSENILITKAKFHKVTLSINKKQINIITDAVVMHRLNNLLFCLAFYNENSLNIKSVLNRFKFLKPVEGRGLVHKISLNKKKINIIDESYNANPDTMLQSIKNLENIKVKNNKKIIILGTMNELGNNSYKIHYKLLQQLDATIFKFVILCGEFFELSVKNLNPNNEFIHFKNTNKIMQFLKEKVHNNDIILIKCSNSTKINKFAKILLKQVSI